MLCLHASDCAALLCDSFAHPAAPMLHHLDVRIRLMVCCERACACVASAVRKLVPFGPFEPNNVRVQMLPAQQCVNALHTLHRSLLPCHCSLRPFAAPHFVPCGGSGERPPLLHPGRFFDHLSGLIHPHRAVSRLAVHTLLHGPAIQSYCTDIQHWQLTMHAPVISASLAPVAAQAYVSGLHCACAFGFVRTPRECCHCMRTRMWNVRCRHVADVCSSHWMSLSCWGAAASTSDGSFVEHKAQQPSRRAVHHNITGLYRLLSDSCVAIKWHMERGSSRSPCLWCCCSGYTRKEPFANHFAGLNWTPK
jgi:hypothetical protein